MAPMGTNFASPEGRITERNALYYRTRAEGGAGLIIVEAAYVDPAQRHRPQGIVAWDDGCIDGMRRLTEAVHGCGVPIFQQLSHPGRVASAGGSAIQPVAPSAVPHPLTGALPRALTSGEITAIADMFAEAASRVRDAGFDGVEIHGGHGYLLASFLSPLTNKRTDHYGGSLGNRMRFPLETLRAVRRAVGPDYPISFRLSATEFLPGGFQPEEAVALAVALEEAGADLLHVSAGTNEQPRSMARCIPLSYTPEGCFSHLAALVRNVVAIPVIAVGRVNRPDVAERILSRGQADLVAVGRAFIADPHWPLKAREGRTAEIGTCVACNEGCIEQLNRHESISCSINPRVGRADEVRSPVRSPDPGRPKRIVVVGGGPAGMKAAEEIAMDGHAVTLFDKGGMLGGQVRLACVPPGKAALLDLVLSLEHRLKLLKVSIVPNRTVTAADIMECDPDAVILATGSRPVLPPIEGIASASVVTVDEVLSGGFIESKCRRFLVVGGGMAGLETAHFLAENGQDVTVVERTGTLGANCSPLALVTLLDRLDACGVTLLTNTEVEFIGADASVRLHHEHGGGPDTLFGVDHVVIAAGRASERSLADFLEKAAIPFHVIGDCRSPRRIIDAIAEAAAVAGRLDGGDGRFR